MKVISNAAWTTGFLRLLACLGWRLTAVLYLLSLPQAAAAQEASILNQVHSGAAVTAVLPQDLSPWGMIEHADWLVKLVMAGLAFASVVTWTIALVKGLEFLIATRRMRSGLAVLHATGTLAETERQLGPSNRPCTALAKKDPSKVQVCFSLILFTLQSGWRR